MLWHILTLLNKFWTSFLCPLLKLHTDKKDADSNWTRKIGAWFPYQSQPMCIPNPTYGRFDSNSCKTPMASHKVTTRTQKAISQHTTTTHHTTSKKQRHHDLPHLPASSGFKCKGECDCCTIRRVIGHDLRNTAMYFLNVKLIIPLFYWLFFCGPLTSVIVDKR